MNHLYFKVLCYELCCIAIYIIHEPVSHVKWMLWMKRYFPFLVCFRCFWVGSVCVCMVIWPFQPPSTRCQVQREPCKCAHQIDNNWTNAKSKIFEMWKIKTENNQIEWNVTIENKWFGTEWENKNEMKWCEMWLSILWQTHYYLKVWITLTMTAEYR